MRVGADDDVTRERLERYCARPTFLATTPRLDWSTLLGRTFAEDVIVCPHCHGRTRILAAVTAPAAIRRILRHLHEPPARAPPSGAREPMFEGADGFDEPA